jgi:hypothetical protein
MASAAEQKTDWNLGETVIWVSTRDYSLILAMSDSSEAETITRAFFDLDRLPKGDAVITVSELRRSPPPLAPFPWTGKSGGYRPYHRESRRQI